VRLASLELEDLEELASSSGDPVDAGLPALAATLDLDVMWPKLSVHAPLASAGGVAEINAVKLIDLKRGRRALIAYELTATNGQPFLIFGKHFSSVAQAKRVNDTLTAVRAVTDERFGRWDVPAPLGWFPDHALVLYAPVAGRFLDEVVGGPESERSLALTGECLAELHGARLPFDRILDLDGEAASLAAWSEIVVEDLPEHAAAASRLTEHLARAASSVTLDPTASIHKDLHYKHVVVGPKLTLLDVDEMRAGDPNYDLAHFAAHLHLLALRTRLSAEPLEGAFLGGYAERARWERDGRYDFFFAYSCLKIAWLLCLGLGVRPRPTGSERSRQAGIMLRLGEASAGSSTERAATATRGRTRA
jgi:streptomycin 6-kinase